jgi:hypothetical protein
MGIFSRFSKKKPPELKSDVSDGDYQVAIHDERMFFKNRNFMIEVTNVKFTAPPSGWQEKEFGILSFTYDIFEGNEYIESMGNEDFEMLVGSWIRSELDSKQLR